MGKAYIDIRVEVELETEEYEGIDGKTYSTSYIEKATASVKKIKNIPADALYSLYESFGQSDRWQLWLQDEIPEAFYEAYQKAEDEEELTRLV